MGEHDVRINKNIVLYPNGSEANPPKISVNQRIVINNPLNSMNVIVIVEIYYNNQWGEAIFNPLTENSVGISAKKVENKIVLQTGNFAIIYNSLREGLLRE